MSTYSGNNFFYNSKSWKAVTVFKKMAPFTVCDEYTCTVCCSCSLLPKEFATYTACFLYSFFLYLYTQVASYVLSLLPTQHTIHFATYTACYQCSLLLIQFLPVYFASYTSLLIYSMVALQFVLPTQTNANLNCGRWGEGKQERAMRIRYKVVLVVWGVLINKDIHTVHTGVEAMHCKRSHRWY
jgi:hypothetical protein